MNKRQKEMAKRSLGLYQDYKMTFNSLEGKRVLFDLMKHHNFIKPSFVKGDPYETAFNEGQRNVILRILTLVDIDITEIKKKIEEGLKDV